MTKAASPIRLQKELMQSATVAAALSHRSAAEQIEYWAFLGRSIAKVIDTDKILAIHSGLAEIKIENVTAPAIDPDTVFSVLEEDRKSGILAENVTSSSVRYQASHLHPGLLEKIGCDGKVTSKQLWLLAGGNGVGKTTFYRTRLKNFGIPFVNADVIAKEIFPDATEKNSYLAVNIAEEIRNKLLQEGRNFCFETVFSYSSKIDFVANAKALGYQVILVFIVSSWEG